MLSVKLKLFEIMDTKDKLNLLFLTGLTYISTNAPGILPTFATSTMDMYEDGDLDDIDHPLNFDLLSNSAITFHHCVHYSQRYHYLQLTPKTYSVLSKPYDGDVFRRTNPRIQIDILCSHFRLDEHSSDFDVVRIGYTRENGLSPKERQDSSRIALCLAGSFLENKWILGFEDYCFEESLSWDDYNNDNAITVFNIY
ncbi:hypothetical protein BCR42DRAFT_426124 [Absidia repens]|uniref:Uncharacterized protein n=1 Tax=Absidia repens TaxID=90262 RepID=A0A1X2I1T4_9FUNG|nr:hypothetical protein BCR42DRAFT_426124 [Absidia repens]